MESEGSIEIDRPIAEVFEYTTDNVADWSLTCVEEEILEATPDVVGSTFRITTEDRGRRMDFQGIVTRHEPPSFSAVELRGDHFDIDVLYSFDDLDGRTRVTQHSTVEGKGFVKVMFFLMGWAMKKSGCDAVEAELASLKAKCEARPRS